MSRLFARLLGTSFIDVVNENASAFSQHFSLEDPRTAASLSSSLDSETLTTEQFFGILELLPAGSAKNVLMPGLVTTSSSALKVAMELRMRVTHGAAMDLLAQDEGDAFWEYYIQHCFPSPASRTPGLRLAVGRCLLDVVKKFISAGVDLRDVDDGGNTVLHSLGAEFDPELLPLLISHGAPIDQCNSSGITPLLAATTSYWTHLHYAVQLIRHGANPLHKTRRVSIFSLRVAALAENLRQAQLRPSFPCDYIRSCIEGGHLFRRLKHKDIVALFEHMDYQDWDLFDPPDQGRLRTLLTTPDLAPATVRYICSEPAGNKYAGEALRLMSGHRTTNASELLSVIKCCGPEIDQVGSTGLTALLHACAAGAYANISTLLANGADSCFIGPNRETSLFLLFGSQIWSLPEAEEAARTLVEAVVNSPTGSSVLEARDSEERTLLHLCIQYDNFVLLRGLIECYRAKFERSCSNC